MPDVRRAPQVETHGVWIPDSSTSSSPAPTTTGFAAPPPSEWQDGRGMATRVTSTRFVGRADELAELSACLDRAAAGTPSLALVAGDSGVGKSRLADALADRAREAGFRVLSGDCVELGEGELPYAPLVAALRNVAREGDAAFDALPPAQLA